MPADDLADWLRLACVPGLGAQGQRVAVSAFGRPATSSLPVAAHSLPPWWWHDGRCPAVRGPAREDRARRMGGRGRQPHPDPGRRRLSTAAVRHRRPPPLLYVKGRTCYSPAPASRWSARALATAAGEANAEWPCTHSPSKARRHQRAGVGIDAAAHCGALAAGGASAGHGGGGSAPASIVHLIRGATPRWHRDRASGAVVSEFSCSARRPCSTTSRAATA